MSRCLVIRDRKKVLSEESIYSVLIGPAVTEKSTLQSSNNQVFFLVAAWANKFFIKTAVEKIFNVKVKSVNTSRLIGKVKRFRGRLGERSACKKAMVCLHDGQSLELITGTSS